MAQTPAPTGIQEDAPTTHNQADIDAIVDEPIFKEQSECEEVVQAFNSGKLKKHEAVVKIYSILKKDDDLDQDAEGKALESYVRILDNFEIFRRSNSIHGLGYIGEGRERDDDEDSQHPSINPGDHIPLEHSGQPHVDSTAKVPPRKRAISPASDSDGEDARGRRRLVTSRLAWVLHQDDVRPELKEYVNSLDNISADPKRTLALLLNSPSCPQFPTSQWTNILAGKFVDLDAVVTGMFTLSGDDEKKETVGSIEITTGAATPSKNVTGVADWINAWDSLTEAFAYVFPNRKPELDNYGRKIRQLFRAYPSEQSSVVINYDKAHRLRVSQTRKFLFTDDFKDLEILWLHNAGSSAPRGAKAGSSSGAGSSIGRAQGPGAQTVTPHALSSTFARSAETLATIPRTVMKEWSGSELWKAGPEWNARPSYARAFMWGGNHEDSLVTLVKSSEIMSPIPSAPPNELHNRTNILTIINNPFFFKIVTPIKLTEFIRVTNSHPNQDFVSSVIRGLGIGFWPMAVTEHLSLPDTLDCDTSFQDEEFFDFIIEQRDKEIQAERFSPPFNNLLPGMMVVPHIVSSKNDKLRLCVDHSASPFSRNEMIEKAHIKVPLDGLQEFGRILRRVRADANPGTEIILWKSDVSKAYRLLPMHPLWQLKQVVKMGGAYCVDRNNNFGNRAAGGLWGMFFSLVLWAAVYVYHITDLLCWVDDTYSWDYKGNTQVYYGYSNEPTEMPTKQARLLELWDALGIPHNREKQISGSVIDIIGFSVDANAMTITLSLERRIKLAEAIESFIAPENYSHRMIEFQRITSWINWALNVFPHLRPGMCTLYEKMAGKSYPSARIYVNKKMRTELGWVAYHIRTLPGIYLLKSIDWSATNADMSIYCDASSMAMAFWTPARPSEGHRCQLTAQDNDVHTIFYHEALCVLSALRWTASTISPPPPKLVIYCDNANTVSMFDTMRATSPYNDILFDTANILLKGEIQLRVVHIPGVQNTIADALSRNADNSLLGRIPRLYITSFTPPRFTTGLKA